MMTRRLNKLLKKREKKNHKAKRYKFILVPLISLDLVLESRDTSRLIDQIWYTRRKV